MTPEELRRRNIEAALVRMRLHGRNEEWDWVPSLDNPEAPWRPKVLPPKPPKKDLLGWNLPLAPTTWENEEGQVIMMSRWDPERRDWVFLPIADFTSGTSTRGWDDEWLTWREFEVTWDGGIPESVRFETAGKSRGLLLEFYESSKLLREAGVRIPTRDTTMPLNPIVPRKKKRGKHGTED